MENDGYITIGTKIDTSSFDSQIASMKKGLESKMSSMENTITKTFGLIKTGIVGAGIALAVKAITNNLDDAIKRLDTLKNYTKVMSNLGVSADDAQASMDRLSEALVGLPTTMDDAVASVQRFTSANSNVGASTEMFLALNNAILAGGANAQTQASALEQLSQAYAKGKPDMMEWRTAMSAMPAQLKQTAQAMGYVSADKLGEALRTGQVSMNDFMLTLVKLNKEGVAGFQSFEEQARNATGGIATSIQNVKTAITRGIAQILDAIGQANIAGFFQAITKAINKTIPYIVAFIKLIGTAINYIASLFGKKVEATSDNVATNVENASNAVGGLNDNLQDTSQDMNDTTKSAKGLGKALSNLQKFDELNVLQAPSDSGGGSGDSSAGGVGNFDLSGMSLTLEEANNETDNLLDNLTNKFKEIAGLFAEGFELSFGNMNFDNIIQHIEGIKNSLISIGTDPNVLNSAKNWAETLMFSLGRVTGSVARIGKNIVELYVGSIDTYLEQNSGRIKDFVKSMFDISAEDMTLTADFAQVLGEISDVFSSDTAKQIGANFLSAIYNPLMSLYQVLQGLALDFKRLIFQPIIDNSEQLKLALENSLSVYEKYTGTLSTAFTNIGDIIKRVYDEHIHPFMQKITTAFSDTFGKFLVVYNEKIKPVMDAVAQKFDEVWKEHLQPAFEKIGGAIGAIFDWVGVYWTTVLKPVVDWIIQNVVPLITTIIGEGFKYLFEQIGNVADIIGGLADIVRGLYEIVVGIFTLDWDKIADGASHIMEGFEGISDAIKNIGKTWLKYFKNVWDAVLKWFYDQFIKPVVDFFKDMWNNVVNSTKEATGKVVDFVKDIWQKIKKVFAPIADWVNDNVIKPIKEFFAPLVDWFTNLFTSIKDFIQSVFNVIKELAKGCVNTIIIVWNVVSGWFNDNVIKPLTNFFTGLWNFIKEKGEEAWNRVKGIWNVASQWFNDTIINPVKEKFTGLWDRLKEGASQAWEGIKNVFGTVATFFQNTFSTAWQRVKDVFSKGGQVFNNIKEGISSVFKGIVQHLIDGINNVVKVPFEKINEALNKLKGFEVFGQHPFNGLPTIPIPQIPRLAKGTILNAPGKGTLVAGGNAIAGEAGREAYLPLSDTQLLEELGSTIGKYITINANIVNSMNGRVISREIKRIQNDENFAYNV